jgi:hypothetical protein
MKITNRQTQSAISLLNQFALSAINDSSKPTSSDTVRSMREERLIAHQTAIAAFAVEAGHADWIWRKPAALKEAAVCLKAA